MDAVAVEYDPFSYQSHTDPYPAYRALRDTCPVYHNAERGFWALTRFADVQAAARDWEAFSSSAGVELDGSTEEFAVSAGSFIDMDPPRHDQLRQVLRHRFTPKAVKEVEGVVESAADELLAECFSEGEVDMVSGFAAPFPVSVTARLLGLPLEDLDLLVRWAGELVVRSPDQAEIPAEARRASTELQAYIREALHEKSSSTPTDDWLGDIARARVDGERLSEDAMVGMGFLLFIASTETTAGSLGMNLLSLERHPEQRAELATDLTRLPPAIEELFRYESPVQNLARITTRGVSVGDTEIPTGEDVLLVFGAANRDERRFENPDRLDIDRDPLRNLAFGEGIHHCIGAPLARLEARVALRRILTEVPEYRVTGEAVFAPAHTTRGLSSLPVAF